jgi:hypothetical protein
MKANVIIGQQDPYAADALDYSLDRLAAHVNILTPHSQTPQEFRAGLTAVEISLTIIKRQFRGITA